MSYREVNMLNKPLPFILKKGSIHNNEYENIQTTYTMLKSGREINTESMIYLSVTRGRDVYYATNFNCGWFYFYEDISTVRNTDSKAIMFFPVTKSDFWELFHAV